MKKILAIEDEAIILESYVKAFTKAGFEVVTAVNGVEGLEKAKNEKPDIIILDLTMPEMSGEEVLEEMNKDPELAVIPVLVLTNKSDGASLMHCKEMGVYSYITKVNVTLNELLKKINQILNI